MTTQNQTNQTPAPAPNDSQQFPIPDDYNDRQGWYSVRLKNHYQRRTCVIDLQALADALPHGSGIDSDWSIHVKYDGSLTIRSSYHKMNDSGMYCGWRDFKFTIDRAKTGVFHALKGPCLGQYQVTRIKGRAYSSSVTGAGRELNEYLTDTVFYSLREVFKACGIDTDHTIAFSEQEAQAIANGQ